MTRHQADFGDSWGRCIAEWNNTLHHHELIVGVVVVDFLVRSDVPRYVGQIKETPSLTKLGDAVKYLSDFPPSKLIVSAESGSISSTDFQTMVSHDDKWELESPLRFY